MIFSELFFAFRNDGVLKLGKRVPGRSEKTKQRSVLIPSSKALGVMCPRIANSQSLLSFANSDLCIFPRWIAPSTATHVRPSRGREGGRE